jgi:hypothetical protein
MTALNFNARNIPPAGDLTPVPSGEYAAVIVDSVLKDTKDKTGQYLELVHEIIDGPFKGRKVWARLNLVNRNPQTVTIAQQQLSAIAHAIDRLEIGDDSELIGHPMLIRVEFRAANPTDPKSRDSNEIKAWKALGGSVAAHAHSAPAMPAPTPAPAVAAAPPWARPAA